MAYATASTGTAAAAAAEPAYCRGSWSGGAAAGSGGAAARGAWSADAVAAVAALRAQGGAPFERRNERRVRYEVWATLVTEGQPYDGTPPRVIYTRDAEPRAVGFVTSEPIDAGSRATFHVTGPDGRPLALTCHVRRCRAFRPGWYEGVLLLADAEPAFVGKRLAKAWQ
jgi:hypothetical protein